jgi:hypothetical protein
MEPIERELADRRAQLQRMAADVRRLLLERIHGPDDDRKLALYSDIAKLRYEIARSEAGIRERPRTPSNPATTTAKSRAAWRRRTPTHRPRNAQQSPWYVSQR